LDLSEGVKSDPQTTFCSHQCGEVIISQLHLQAPPPTNRTLPLFQSVRTTVRLYIQIWPLSLLYSRRSTQNVAMLKSYSVRTLTRSLPKVIDKVIEETADINHM